MENRNATSSIVLDGPFGGSHAFVALRLPLQPNGPSSTLGAGVKWGTTEAEHAAYRRAYYQAHKAELAVKAKQYRDTHKEEMAARRQEHRAEIAAKRKAYRQTHKADAERYYHDHKAEIAMKGKARRKSHKAEAAAHHESHKVEIAAYAKAWRQRHKTEKAASDKAWRQTHRAEYAAYLHDYQQTHKVEIAMKRETRYQLHRAEVAAQVQAWALANPDKVADNTTRRRARKLGATVEKVSRAVVFERDAGRCHLCGKKVNPKKWHLDHITPLALGGEHSYKNVAVSHAKCNLTKGAKVGAQLRLL